MPSKTDNAIFPPAELREIVYEVVELLKDRGETISCGETVSTPEQRTPCPIPDHYSRRAGDEDERGLVADHVAFIRKQAAGGLISAAILSVPGASAVYRGGLTVRLLCISTPRPIYCGSNGLIVAGFSSTRSSLGWPLAAGRRSRLTTSRGPRSTACSGSPSMCAGR